MSDPTEPPLPDPPVGGGTPDPAMPDGGVPAAPAPQPPTPTPPEPPAPSPPSPEPPAPTPPPPEPPVASPAEAAPSKANGGLVLAVILVLALVGSLVVLLSSKGSSNGPSGEVVLEAASSPGDDPFAVDLAEPPLNAARVVDPGPPFARPRVEVGTDPVPMSATEPGLYGGTRDAGRCDVAQLVAFLQSDEAKARAWADVHDIETDEIEAFVAGLTPVLLRTDTQVTNHGFRDGSASAFQAVLESGTAVLVDESGVPRVKCNCGNPLLTAQPTESPEYVGSAWDGFDAQQVASPQPSAPVSVFVLVDPTSGAPFVRAAGTDGTADVEAPTATDVSDPIGRAVATLGESGGASGNDQGGGSIRFAAGGEAAFGFGDGVAITDSTVDLRFPENGGPVEGTFTVALDVSTDTCDTTASLDGTFTGSFDGGAALSGTWSGSVNVEPADGCDGPAQLTGDWAAIFDSGARLVSGSMSVGGAGLFDFDLQTG